LLSCNRRLGPQRRGIVFASCLSDFFFSSEPIHKGMALFTIVLQIYFVSSLFDLFVR
jgi:hypothetical protein